MDRKNQAKFNFRGFTTFVVTISFLIMLVSGVFIYLSPAGRVARDVGWTILGLDKWQWAAVHTSISLLFLILAAGHLYFNWKIMLTYFRSRMEQGFRLKRELALALMVGGLFVGGTLWNLPPFSKINEIREEMKHSPARAGETSQFVPGQGQGQGRARFIDAGKSDTCTAVRPVYNRTFSAPGRIAGGRGYGRMTVDEYCKAQGLETEWVLNTLRARGIEASKKSSVRALATTLGTSPGNFLSGI
jgi:Domain of unknown function (DUF4405)